MILRAGLRCASILPGTIRLMVEATLGSAIGVTFVPTIGRPLQIGQSSRPGRLPTVCDGLTADPVPEQGQCGPPSLPRNSLAVRVEGPDKMRLPNPSREVGGNSEADEPAPTTALQVLSPAHP